MLLQFRKGNVALVCDVAKMYLRVKLAEKDKKFVRFFWRDLDQSRVDLPEVYEFNKVVFGLNSSSFLAQFVIQRDAEKYRKDYPQPAETILKSTFMDDSMDSVKSVEAGLSMHKDLSELYNSAGMHARKWVSNSKQIMEVIPVDDRASNLNLNEDTSLPIVKTLGLWWNANDDHFKYQVSEQLNGTKTTKRKWLSKVATLLDPLGFVSPFAIRALMLIQKNWVKGYD